MISLAAVGQTPGPPADHTPIPMLPSGKALSILMPEDKLPSPLSVKPSAEGMLVYRVVVDVNGGILRKEPITTAADLQPEADAQISNWRFRPIETHGARTPWWSFVGLCYAPSWPRFAPCAPPKADLHEYSTATVPTRIDATGLGLFEGGPASPPRMKPVRSTPLDYPPTARDARIQGIVQLEVLLGSDGHVQKTTVFSGHPMLAARAEKTVQEWQWSPMTFMGQSVEASFILQIGYSLSQGVNPQPIQ